MKKRFKDTITAKTLNGLYAITGIEWFDDKWVDLCHKYYYGK